MDNQKPVPSGSSLNDLLEAKNLLARAVDELERCLEATHSFYDIVTEKVISVPDYRTRLAAVTMVLAYTEGLPVERREMVTRRFTTLEDLEKQTQNSPEFRRGLQELLAKTEKPVGLPGKAGESTTSA